MHKAPLTYVDNKQKSYAKMIDLLISKMALSQDMFSGEFIMLRGQEKRDTLAL